MGYIMAAETCNDSIRLRKPGNEGYWSLKTFFFIGFFCSRIGCLTKSGTKQVPLY